MSQVLGAILTPAPVSTLQIGQAPNSSFLVSMWVIGVNVVLKI